MKLIFNKYPPTTINFNTVNAKAKSQLFMKHIFNITTLILATFTSQYINAFNPEIQNLSGDLVQKTTFTSNDSIKLQRELERDIIFYANFENTTQAILSAGKYRVDNPSPDFIFTQGKTGRGILISENTKSSAPIYSAIDNIDSEKGTLAFWFKPEWDSTQPISGKMPRYLFSSRTQSNKNFYLYAKRTSIDFGYYNKSNKTNWKANEWHHVSLVWDKKQTSIYIDGILSSNKKVNKNWKKLWQLSNKFTLGGYNRKLFASGTFDEFGIWKRPLTHNEIASIYRKGISSLPISNNPDKHQHYRLKPRQEASPETQRINKLINGSFEAGHNNWLLINTPAPTSPVEPSFVSPQFHAMTVNISHDESHHGKNSLQLTIEPRETNKLQYQHPRQGTALLRTLAFHLDNRKNYSASLRFKANSDKPIDVIFKLEAMRANEHLPEFFRKHITVKANSNKWHLLEISGIPYKAYDDLYRLQLLIENHSDSTVNAYVDSITVTSSEINKSDPEFKYNYPITSTLHTKKLANIFTKNEAINIDISLANQIKDKSKSKLSFNVYDLWGNHVFSKTINPILDGLEQSHTIAQPNIKDYGIYRATISNTDNNDIIDEITFSVLPPTTDNKHLGILSSYDNYNLLVAKRLGIKWVRLWDNGRATAWPSVQPSSPDEFLWEYSDTIINKIYSNNFELLGQISWPQNTKLRRDWTTHTKPHWLDTKWSNINPPVNGHLLNTELLYNQEFVNEWIHYVESLVSHYKDKIHYWELLNEPYNGGDAKWVSDLYSLTVPIIRKANPNAVIVGPSVYIKPKWMNQLINKGILNYIDIFSYHGYRLSDKDLKTIHKWSSSDQNNRPVFDTENSAIASSRFFCQSCKGKEFSGSFEPVESASRISKNFVSAMAAGTDAYFYYWMVHYDAYEKHNSLIDHSGWLRAPAIAYTISAWLIADLENKDQYVSRNNHKIHIFNNDPNTQTTAVLWNLDENPPHDVTYIKHHDGIRIYNMMGAVIHPDSKNNLYKININTPIYMTSNNLKLMEQAIKDITVKKQQ